MPLHESFHVGQLIASNEELFAQYESLGKRSINDDIEVILGLELASGWITIGSAQRLQHYSQ